MEHLELRVAALHSLVDSLRRVEESYINLIDSVQAAIVTTTDSGIIKSTNRAWSQISGYKQSDILNQDLSTYLISAENDHRLPLSAILPSRDSEIRDLECRLLNSKGELVWCSYSAVYNPEDDTVTATLTDVPYSIKVECERTVIERSRTQFFSSISHDLRPPLLAVIGSADLMSSQDNQSKEIAGRIREQAGYLLEMLDEIVEYSKLEVKETKVNDKIFDLHKLIKNEIYHFRGLAESRGLILKYEVDPSVPILVKTDENKIRRILQKLISNACKYTEKGSIEVCCKGQISNDSCRLQWSIEDTGPGIPEDKIPLLFQPYKQIDYAHLAASTSGVGLGLVICQRLVRLLGGDIEVQSQEGRGSIFHFSILVSVSDDFSLPATKPIGLRPPQIKALIVDDNRSAQKILGVLLEKLGIEKQNIVIAGSVNESKKKYQDSDFHIVFADMYLPDGDGIELTRWIRSLSESKKKPFIVACTASTNEHEHDAMSAAGVDGFLIKPFTFGGLMDVVRTFFYC